MSKFHVAEWKLLKFDIRIVHYKMSAKLIFAS
jgi:hypothetical protein